MENLVTNDAEWDEATKEMADDKPMVLYELTGSPSLEQQLEFWRGIAATRLQHLKEAAKVIGGLLNRNYAVICNDGTLDKAKEFIDAWGDDDE